MELTLQELIDAATGAGPDATDEQRAEAVANLLAERGGDAEAFQNQALEQYQGIRDGGDTAEETLAALSALADVIGGTRLRQGQLDEAAKARAEELAALDSRVNPVEPVDGTDGTDGGEGEDGEGTDGDAGEGGTDGDGGEGGDGGAGGEGAPAGEAAPAAVAASGRRAPVRVNLSAVRRPKATQPVDTAPSAVITASADVPGYSPGQKLDLPGLTQATIARMGAFPTERIPNTVMRAGIARIKIPFADKALIADDTKRDQDVLDYAGDMKRLKGGSLVAAGGWCSPSVTFWELCPGLESASAGILDVPDIQVTRGGIRVTEGPDIAAVFADIGFTQTETQAIAGDTKPNYRVPCPAFTETRASVTGVNIVSGILQDDAYPEMTRRIVELAMAVHAHKVNLDTIAAMVTQSTDLGTINAGISATTSVLNVIEMQVVDYRYRYRAPENLMLDLVAPMFLKAVIRADLTLRTGVPFEQVTDQQINGYFNARGVNVQWVYDWQDAFSGVTAGFGATAPVEEWPDTVKLMIHASGSFVRGRGEIISMEGVYDSTNLEVNDFTRLFMEEKFLVKRRCYQSRTFTVPLAVNGATGCCVEVDANGNVVVPTP